MYINKSIKIFDKVLKIKSGWFAKNTASSILAEIDGTVLLVTVVYLKTDVFDFLPLKIEYFEKFYASGKIPYNHLKREGKPTEREILIARLIDRCIRPMFPKNLNFDIQITVTVISINSEINPDVIAINSVSIALFLSDLPFKPIFALRLLYKNSNVFFNLNTSESKDPEVEMIVSGSYKRISMLEGSFSEISSGVLLFCINNASFNIDKLLFSILELKKFKRCRSAKLFSFFNVISLLKRKYFNILFKLFCKNSYSDIFILNFKDNILNILCNFASLYKKKFLFILDNFFNYVFRRKILFYKVRDDFRKSCDLRKFSLNSGFLMKVHGSSVFSRGKTQALVSITLGTYKDAQFIDCVFFSHYRNNFILHYNFPSYAVNEIGGFNSVKRREIGHGSLARKALLCLMPEFEKFPYVIRIVSEILSSDGSSSMATVCGSSLALMNAGVPIKSHVAGIAMGLIKEGEKYIILSDISGNEDFFGDMDFKITSTRYGFTSLQMDLKINGLSISVINDVVIQSKRGLDFILTAMEQHIFEPRKYLFDGLPKVKILKIDKTKIGSIIGKNGVIIKSLMEKYSADIDIEDNGVVRVSSLSLDNLNALSDEINSLVIDFKIGMVFEGKIVKLTQFGAFVDLFYRRSGLLHVSKINRYKSINQDFNVSEGTKVNVKIVNIDFDGKVSLDFV